MESLPLEPGLFEPSRSPGDGGAEKPSSGGDLSSENPGRRSNLRVPDRCSGGMGWRMGVPAPLPPYPFPSPLPPSEVSRERAGFQVRFRPGERREKSRPVERGRRFIEVAVPALPSARRDGRGEGLSVLGSKHRGAPAQTSKRELIFLIFISRGRSLTTCAYKSHLDRMTTKNSKT